MSVGTQWQTGRLDAARGSQRLLFGQMYEDVEIERAAFRDGDRVFCIASAGCTAMALSNRHDVVACDINPAQLAYAESRVRGAPARTGDAEQGMAFARFFMPLAGWTASLINEFLALSGGPEQLAFWHHHLDTRRFRVGFDMLLSHAILNRVYAAQFLSFLPPQFGPIVRARLERGFALHPNATNHYIQALFSGEPPSPSRPHNPSRIQFVLSDAASYLESCPAASFDAFTLSNILDGGDPSYRARLSQAVRHSATANAVVVMRSFAEPRPDLATNHAARDRAMLWGVVDLRNAQSF
jgi:S-adenosylmethionine:diacylglycerol 3-amino-3-carboxypropyl transferase